LLTQNESDLKKSIEWKQETSSFVKKLHIFAIFVCPCSCLIVSCLCLRVCCGVATCVLFFGKFHVIFKPFVLNISCPVVYLTSSTSYSCTLLCLKLFVSNQESVVIYFDFVFVSCLYLLCLDPCPVTMLHLCFN